MECKTCNKSFTQVKESHIFCSKYCREKHWRKHNKQHVSNYAKAYRIKTIIILCKHCKTALPESRRHKGGILFCSDKCIKERRKTASRKRHHKTQKLFYKFKCKKGCQNCGYNKCGACLDFHHIDPKTKKLRITAKHWISKSKLIRDEIKKCILLCKNCHYEEHFKWRRESL